MIVDTKVINDVMKQRSYVRQNVSIRYNTLLILLIKSFIVQDNKDTVILYGQGLVPREGGREQ